MKVNHLILSFTVATTVWAHPKLPLAFFAKVNGTFKPLSGVYSKVTGSEFKVLSFGDSWHNPTEFSLQGNYAVTEDESVSKYLSFHRGRLGFSPSIYKVLLEFDETMRVLNNPFISCLISPDQWYMVCEGDVEIPQSRCFEVEIYLLPYDKSTGTVKPALVHKNGMTPDKQGSINESVEKEDGSSEDEKHEGEKHKPKEEQKQKKQKKNRKEKQKKNRKEKQKKNGKQAPKKEIKDKPKKNSLKKDLSCQISPSTSSAERPLVLVAKVKDTYIPLSSSIFGNGKMDTNALAYTPSGDEPVVFSLQDNYAVTDNKLSPGYLGLRRGMLTFGPKVRKTRLDLDGEQKVLNARFRSCKVLNTEVRFIIHGTSHIPQSDCFDVEIYLLRYDPKTGSVFRLVSGKEELPTVLLEVEVKHKSGKKVELEPKKEERVDASVTSIDSNSFATSSGHYSDSKIKVSTSTLETSQPTSEPSQSTSEDGELRPISYGLARPSDSMPWEEKDLANDYFNYKNVFVSKSSSMKEIVQTSEWNSYTDCPTQCSKEVTVTITACDKESNPSTVIVTTSSTVTIVSATTVTVTEV